MNRLKLEDPNEELPRCFACDYPVPESDLHDLPTQEWGVPRPARRLCTLCDNTPESYTLYPAGKIPSHEIEMVLHQNFCTNAILDQLGAFNT